MSYVCVLPSIYQPYTDACLRSMSKKFRDITIVIDNTVENKGVAASWNVGIDQMYKRDVDWLILISAAIRFEDLGGLDFLAELRNSTDDIALEGGWGLGFHLIAFHRQTFDKVGRFDEQFHPGYLEDMDWAYRVHKEFGVEPPYWRKVDVEAYVRCFAHATRFAGVQADHDKLLAYYVSKHGGPPGHETR